MTLQLLVTDRNLVPVGDPIAEWNKVEATLRFNEPGTGTVNLTASSALRSEQLAPGNRMVLIRDGAVFLAGPIEKPGAEDWAVAGAASGPGITEVSWADDLALIAGRVTFPNPAQAATAQTVARWERTGAAGTLIRDLVDTNAGPSALAARRVPRLVIGTTVAGATITFGTRFEQLLDAARAMAISGGGLGFRTTQVGSTIVFEVYQPRDLRNTVRFSKGLGNMRSYAYDPAAPTVTVAIVGGQDEGADRTIVERIDAAAAAAWWRAEVFVDQRQTDVGGELERAGDEAITRGARTARLVTETIDTPDQRYGTHYDLGDRVSVELSSGVVVDDVVRAVTLTHTPADGERVAPLVGSTDTTTDQQAVALLRDLMSRVGRLETR